MPVLKPSFLSTYIAIKTNKFNKLREFTNEESLCDTMDYSPPGSLVHGDSQGKSTGEGFHDILQGIVPTQDSNQDFLFTS